MAGLVVVDWYWLMAPVSGCGLKGGRRYRWRDGDRDGLMRPDASPGIR